MKRIIGCVVIAVSLTGCASGPLGSAPLKLYNGAERNSSEVGYIALSEKKLEGGIFDGISHEARIDAINGEAIADHHRAVEVVPGHYNLSVKCRRTGGDSDRMHQDSTGWENATQMVKIGPGERYEIAISETISMDGKSCSAKVINTRSKS